MLAEVFARGGGGGLHSIKHCSLAFACVSSPVPDCVRYGRTAALGMRTIALLKAAPATLFLAKSPRPCRAGSDV